MCDHLISAAKHRDHVTANQLKQKILNILTNKHGAWGAMSQRCVGGQLYPALHGRGRCLSVARHRHWFVLLSSGLKVLNYAFIALKVRAKYMKLNIYVSKIFRISTPAQQNPFIKPANEHLKSVISL